MSLRLQSLVGGQIAPAGDGMAPVVPLGEVRGGLDAIDEEVPTQGGIGDGAESINWDEDSDKEEQRRYRRKVSSAPQAQAVFPQTLGFWYDIWLAEIAAATINVRLLSFDFCLCLRGGLDC